MPTPSDKPESNDDKPRVPRATVAEREVTPEAQRDTATRERARVETSTAAQVAALTAERDPRSAAAEKPVEAPPKPITEAEAANIAKGIDKAFNGGLTGIGSDYKTVETLLRGKSPDDIAKVDAAFKRITGHNLDYEFRDELSGELLDRGLELLKGRRDTASRIRTSESQSEILGALSTSSKQDIDRMDATFRERYGTSLRDSVMNNSNLSAEAKMQADVLLHGADKLSAADYRKLMSSAVASRDRDLLRETITLVPEADRLAYLNAGGRQEIINNFGNRGFGILAPTESNKSREVLALVTEGKLSAARIVDESSGWMGDNEDAIRATLSGLTPAERTSYANGKTISAQPETGLTDAQRADRKYYQNLHDELKANATTVELAAYEDLIKYPPGGTVIQSLARHEGTFYNDGVDKVLGTLNGISAADWQKLKDDPAYRAQVDGVLRSLISNDGDYARTQQLLNSKAQTSSFEASRSEAKVPVLDAFRDSQGVFSNDKAAALAALKGMTPEEQNRYRTNPEFKRQLDEQVRTTLSDASLVEGRRYLERVMRNEGETPETKLLTSLNNLVVDDKTERKDLVTTLERAFRENPELRERIANPKNDADRKLAEEFATATKRVIAEDETFDYNVQKTYDRFVKPIVETGRIPITEKAEFYRGNFSDDEAGFLNSLRNPNSGEADWQEVLASDSSTSSLLNAEQRAIATSIASQKGEAKPEDVLRALVIGDQLDDRKVADILSAVNPMDRAAVASAYEAKYGKNMTADLLDAVSKSERAQISRLMVKPETSQETFLDASAEVKDSMGYLGRKLVDATDGTGYLTTEALEQYRAAMTSAAKSYADLPEAKRAELEDSLTQALHLYQQSEEAAANAVVDGAIIAASVAGAAVTGGVSLSAIAYVAGAGALGKVGAKMLIQGEDYDATFSGASVDLATGAFDSATMFLGPVQLAKMVRLGEAAAVRASEGVVARTARMVASGESSLLREGAEQKLKTELTARVTEALGSGSAKIEDKVVSDLAKQLARTPADAAKLEQIIRAELASAIPAEAGNAVRATLRDMALNAGAGSTAGAGSEFIRSAVAGKSPEEIAQATFQGGLFGGLLGGTVSGGLSAARHGLGSSAARALEDARVGDDIADAGRGTPRVPGDAPPQRVETTPSSRTDAPTESTELPRTPGDAPPQRADEAVPPAERPRVGGRSPEREAPRVAEISEKFRPLTDEQRALSVQRVSDELRDIPAVRGADGKTISVYDTLMNYPELTAEQKERILRNMAQVREHFASYRVGDNIHPDPEVNWIHTMGELGQVIEASRRNNLSVTEMEDAVLASMYSDAVKFSPPPPEGVVANFHTHHLDGAIAAAEALSREGLPPERLNRILNAVREHQIAPPDFMGRLYFFPIANTLSNDVKVVNAAIEEASTVGGDASKLPGLRARQAELQEEQRLLESLTVQRGGPAISFIADIDKLPADRFRLNENGGFEVALTDAEKRLLSRAGVDSWYVPARPELIDGVPNLTTAQREALSAQYRVAQSLIDGDGIDNYSTTGGASKIFAIRGPGKPMFKDPTWQTSYDSIASSFGEAYRVMSPEAQAMATANWTRLNDVIHSEEFTRSMDRFIRDELKIDPKTAPFWQTPLQYPENAPPSLSAIGGAISEIRGRIASGNLTGDALAAQQTQLSQLQNLENAWRIRDQIVTLLRQDHQISGRAPTNFQSSR